MRYIFVLASLVVGCYGDVSYEKALEKCKPLCNPQSVKRVDYNFNNNKLDKCVCSE
jgi:hypothetical protein